MNIAEKMTKTWNWHEGRPASVNAMNKMLDIGNHRKATIKEQIFKGGDKLVFFVEASGGLDYIDIYDTIRDYTRQQYHKDKGPFWRGLYNNETDEFLYHILDNLKMHGNKSLYPLIHIFGNYLDLTWQERIRLSEHIENSRYPSPKLTKQIIKIGRDNNYPDDIIHDILSNLSVVQSFKPAKLSKAKLVLSIDPIDFITGSLNDYNWSSCTTPNGCHAAMPLGLYMDAFTIIAYIESEKSEYILFRENGAPVTGSNKKMRRYIHFNTDYSGLILNQTYPHVNPAFDKALIKIFEDLGFPLEMEKEIKEEVVNRADFDSTVIYDDLDNYNNLVRVMGKHETFTVIGNEPLCVHCGNYLESYDEEDEFVNQGLCYNCAVEMGFYNDRWDDEKEEWY